jgi:PEP-CTERM motif
MEPSNRKCRSNRGGLITFLVATLSICGAAPVMAGPLDLVRSSCGYSYGPHDFDSQEIEHVSNSSVVCTDNRFGTLRSSSYIDGTELGAYAGIDWNANPPTRVPSDGSAVEARAILRDVLLVPGIGTGSMTVSMPVHGYTADSAYFSLLTTVVLETGGPAGGTFQTYFGNGSVNQTFNILLPFILGQPFDFFAMLRIQGGPANGQGLDYFDGFADFSNTVDLAITRLQDEFGADIPLNLLTSDSGRQFTPASSVPEPETGVMLLTGFGLMSLLARRQKSTRMDRFVS